MRALVRTPSRLAHNYQTNGTLSASTPASSVTVAFPSTVMMTRRKFPKPLGAEVEQT